MKKLLPIIGLLLVFCVGYGQPGSKLPTINKSAANKETKKLPAIQQKTNPQPATPPKSNAPTVTNTHNYANDEVNLNDLIKEYVYDLMTTNGVSLSCSFYGGTRYAVGVKTQSGGMAVLSALPALFDNKYEYASDCYTLIREINAQNAEGQTWEVEKSEYAKEFAPGFYYIPANEVVTRCTDIVTPASERISGYMVWFVKGKDGGSDYIVVNEELNFNGSVTSMVRQPSVNAIAGVFFDDSPNVSLCAVARQVDGRWELVRVTTTSEQIEADAQKALTKQPSNPVADQSKVEPSKTEQPQAGQSKGKNPKSDSSKPGKNKNDKHKSGRDGDSRRENSRGGDDRASDAAAPNERGVSNDVVNERELQGESPRDAGRGGGDDTESRR